MKANNILFIGFMGVGKGRLARELSARTDFFALDTDDLIESFENRKIKKRPLFQDVEKARALFAARQPLYTAKADMVIDVPGRSAQDIADEIMNRLELVSPAEA